MENVPGGSLEKFWHSHGTCFVPVETTVDLMKQVCRGLSIAHRQRAASHSPATSNSRISWSVMKRRTTRTTQPTDADEPSVGETGRKPGPYEHYENTRASQRHHDAGAPLAGEAVTTFTFEQDDRNRVKLRITGEGQPAGLFHDGYSIDSPSGIWGFLLIRLHADFSPFDPDIVNIMRG